MCVVPPISAHQPDWRWCERQTEVPILLVRNDGVIYNTGLSFKFVRSPLLINSHRSITVML